MTMFEDIISQKEMPVVTADERGVITQVNQRFEKVFEWNREDLLGHPVTVIIPAKLHDAHNLGFSKFIMTGIPSLLEEAIDLEIMTGKGETVKAEHLIAMEEKDGQKIFAARIAPRA